MADDKCAFNMKSRLLREDPDYRLFADDKSSADVNRYGTDLKQMYKVSERNR